jgi:hypothetical protein
VPSKGKHTEANRRKRRNLFPIMFRIYDLHYNKGEPLDESGAFRTTGKEFGYSAVTIRRMHDAAPELLKYILSRGVREATAEDLKSFDE